MNLTKEEMVIEVDKEWKTGNHKYFHIAMSAVSKRFDINPMTLNGYYYMTKKKKMFNVWINQANSCVMTVKAENKSEAQGVAIRKWREENKYPIIADVQDFINSQQSVEVDKK